MSDPEVDEWQDASERMAPGVVLIIGVLIAALLLGWLVLVPAFEDDGRTVSLPRDGRTRSSAPAQDAGAVSSTARTSEMTGGSPPPASTDPGAVVGAATAPATASTRSSTAPSPTSVASAPAGAPTSRPPSSSERPAAPTGAAAYPTLPDGSPEPVLAVFDVDTITLAGAVPSAAAAERLKSLAIANSKTPATIVDRLTIDPDVPVSVPVRVLELTSARFPEASAAITPEHALELDRVATVMEALPTVTVVVVGHSDQRGEERANYLLSEQRAQAVVSYLVGQGVDPSRLASRAVGEADLISLAEDEGALALNRRTEFVFSGLLVGA
jgi:OOP family OmpA-OmpF porin